MRITFSDAGKRFNRDWIFRHFTYSFLPGQRYAITGANGSGKSTLLQVISGSMAISEGKVQWQTNEQLLVEENVIKHLSLTAPYLDIIEEMTATEFLHFHHRFKQLQPNLSIVEIINIVGLEKSAGKQVRYYSSGMKQRLKLAQAIFSDTPLLLLDEPCTNLDSSGIDLYQRLIAEYTTGKTIVVSSNDKNEYAFCDNFISIADYK
jgi:ABC-type multidrug transport system ATPase subunit